MEVVLYGLFAIWGLMVLGLHLYAESTTSLPFCSFQVRPWFVAKAACGLVRINYQRLGITGTEGQLNKPFESLDLQFVRTLIFRRCPALEMPSSLQNLSYLANLKAYNFTIVQWDERAMLTQQWHPQLMTVYLALTNLTQFPIGLTSNEIPTQLADVEFSFTNLSTLPDELDTKWNKGMVIVLDHSTFHSIPDVVVRLQPAFLSFCKNEISDVPVGLFTNPQAQTLWLTGNPLNGLPEKASLTLSESLWRIRIGGTNIHRLPNWMHHDFFTQVDL